MMGKQMPMSAAVGCFRPVVLLLLLVTCVFPLLSSSLAASDALPGLEDVTYPYHSILSPLLRALSEHGVSRWSSGLRRKMKPEHRYMKYLTEVYKTSSRVQRSVDGNQIPNTIRLIKPQEACLPRSNNGHFMQILSYSLDQVRRKEQHLRSALLYSLVRDNWAPVHAVCHLSIKEQGQSRQCPLCVGIHRTLNFTTGNDERRRRSRSWVEVDVTWFFQHFGKDQKNINLLINVTCLEEPNTRSNVSRETLEFILRSPPLILYLNDTSKVAHQRSPVNASTDQRLSSSFQKLRRGHKRRWRRDSSKSKQGNMQLPELLPSSEFPTTDCALYDFKVRFSQLEMDHWIVFPPKYNPRYCSGICPRTIGFIYGSPVHTMVQNIIYEKLDSSIPRPSCVPSHYNPLSVIIFEEDGSYVYKEFEDMVATRCTCR
ncbi:growth/differentiatio [Nothobranchius furzeri]|uniref:Growth differentiation factor 9 n=1 Tax=Nothobranchius furzeri TaxID=105023 RepID=A0A8C6LBT8_NOTFU|nr:growth differentiation factor 9 [Nothobranchius furzeri]